MFGMSLPHLILAGAVVLVLFGGKGKISDLMGDFAKGIKSFKKGMSDDDVDAKPVSSVPVNPVTMETTRTIDHRMSAPVESTTETRRVG